MAVDRRFLLLCAGEILVVAIGDLLAALVLQMVVLTAFLDDRRGYPVFAGVLIIFAAFLSVSGRIFIPLLALAGVLGCGYLALSLQDYRIARLARGSETLPGGSLVLVVVAGAGQVIMVDLER